MTVRNPNLPLNRREAKKQAFYNALRGSLEDLISQGRRGDITQAMVISNARFPNGKPVGATTLFGKNKNKEFIHQEFMKELDGLVKKANKTPHRKVNKGETASEAVKRLRNENKKLYEEYQSVLQQFIELEESQKKISANSDKNRVKSLEASLYVFSCLLNNRIEGALEEVKRVVNDYEIKYSGQARLNHAKERVVELELKIYNSRVYEINPQND